MYTAIYILMHIETITHTHTFTHLHTYTRQWSEERAEEKNDEYDNNRRYKSNQLSVTTSCILQYCATQSTSCWETAKKRPSKVHRPIRKELLQLARILTHYHRQHISTVSLTWSGWTVYEFFFARSLAWEMFITKLMMEMMIASVTKSAISEGLGEVIPWPLIP